MQARKRWRRRVLPCINSASWSALRRLAALATPRRTLSCFGRTPRPITPRPRHAVGGRATSTAVLPWQARTLPALARIRPPLLQGIPPRRKPPASVGAALAFVLRPLLHCTTSCVPSSSPAPTAARSASSSSPASSASSSSSASTAAPGGGGAPGLAWPGLVRSTGRRAHWISQAGLVLLAAVEIGVSMTLRARCLTAAAAGALVAFSTTRLPTCHPQKSSESDSSRSEWTPQSSRQSATISRSGTGAFVFDMGPGSNGMPAAACHRERGSVVWLWWA